MKKKVYIAMSADLIHPGHLNIIKVGQQYGEVIVGVLTDEAIASYKRLPYMNFAQRKEIIENIKGVSSVVAQTTLDYIPNLREIRPDYVVHGTDWREGVQKQVRQVVQDTLCEWGGSLIEVEYTEGISSTQLNKALKTIGTTPGIRLSKLRRLIHAKNIVRVMEAHSGLSGLIVENTNVVHSNKTHEFDALWLSSLTNSTMKGKPDIEYVDITSRMQTINEILDVTTKPVIFDGDSGGIIEHFIYTVKSLERIGVSAIIIEDKIGLKKNSLFEDDNLQQQDCIENFVAKIKAGKKAQITDDFMIIARIESLTLGAGVADALQRAKAYIAAGADAILLHAKKKDISELRAFTQEYANFQQKVALIAVPSAYAQVTEDELYQLGFSIVIYANHLLRSAYPVMVETAKTILRTHRALEADEHCMPISEIINLIK